MKNDNQDNGRKFERLVLYLIIVGILGFVALRTVRLVNATSNSQDVRYYDGSPLPTFTFTPSPAAPTDTPPPPTPTDTATPTQLPPTATDTATPTQLPPTATDTATPTQLPPTATDTATPTQLPPTATDTATPTQLPPTATDTATPTQLPPTATDTATPTQLPPTATDTATPTQLPPTPTDTATPTPLPPTPTDTATPTPLPPTPTDTATQTPLPPTPTDTATATPLPPTPTNTPVPPTATDSQVRTAGTLVPDGDKVTGSGWIDSPPGAHAFISEATGKAYFGFVYNHKNGANSPTDNTIFQFDEGGLKLKSESTLWLVINHDGGTAVYMGKGTTNGQPSNFMVWVGDDPDTFRIKIWSVSGIQLYDNGSDQAIGGGSIVIHKNN